MARFSPGDRVTVAARFPTGPRHLRTPHYIRGKTGAVERICGDYKNPEDLAFGKYDTGKQPLYRVRFEQSHVWPDYDGSAQDKVEVELYEHWLEPAEGDA